MSKHIFGVLVFWCFNHLTVTRRSRQLVESIVLDLVRGFNKYI